ncbi:MAG: magnesium transporter, partial [Lachnospiraceae bacterium]|nr:magnesium transporter [Lachnospiraceae bacterium]
VLGVMISSVVGIFEAVVAVLPVIVSFQSLILGMAGNAGTQSLAVTNRVLMDEELSARQKLKLAFKEMKVGLCNGLVLGAITFTSIGLYIHFLKGGAWTYSYLIAGCVGAALMLAMLISSLVGTVVPMFFHSLKVDPAVASGPLITTVNDLVAILTYYGLSWIFLIGVFHLG